MEKSELSFKKAIVRLIVWYLISLLVFIFFFKVLQIQESYSIYRIMTLSLSGPVAIIIITFQERMTSKNN